jgi:hypothetical protein
VTFSRPVLIIAAALASLVLAGGAAAVTPLPPSATTKAASSVTSKSAKLNGTVNPQNQATTYYFEFGTSTAYGTKTASLNAGSGSRDVNVSSTISGLAGATTYHYRVVASNGTGTSLGADQSFTTNGPPEVTTGSATGVGVTTATLTGSVNPKGLTTSWQFEYGTTTAYGSKTPSKSAGAGNGATVVSAAIAGLAPGTTYHFRLVASSSAGTTDGADLTFATPVAVTINTSGYRVVAGGFVALSGVVTGAAPGIVVTIYGQSFGSSSNAQVATVLTGGGGTWSYEARPKIQTAFQAGANSSTSAAVTIGVQPSVSLARISGARLLTRVSAASSFAGKQVKLQRADGGRWVTVSQKRLSSSSGATFPETLFPTGTSTVRVAISVNQAGPGYLGGLSRELTIRR